MTNTELKAAIDLAITSETTAGSVTPADVGEKMKEVVDYVDQEKRPYKVYVAQITQSGTDAPTVVVFENTIGNIVWSRSDSGDYYGSLSGSFTVNKTFIPNNQYQIDNSEKTLWLYRMNENAVNLQTKFVGSLNDNILNSTPIEIRVYD